MKEYWFDHQFSTKTKNKLSYYFTILSSFILSNPLYFSYLIFFSPYIFKLLSFLSPLFFTTFLLFLSLLTTFIPLSSIINNSKHGFFINAYNTLLENSNAQGVTSMHHPSSLEDFQVFKVVFENEFPTIEQNPVHIDTFQDNPLDVYVEKVEETTTTTTTPESEKDKMYAFLHSSLINREDVSERPLAKVGRHETSDDSKCESLTINEQEKVCTKVEYTKSTMHAVLSLSLLVNNREVVSKRHLDQVKRMETSNTSIKCESLTMEEQEKVHTKPKVVKKEEEKVEESIIIKRCESNVNEGYKTPKSWSLKYDNDSKKLSESFSKNNALVEQEQAYMGSFRSMRKEKEWRRTLACKLFEERHNNNGSEEGMDLLWETHENDSNKVKSMKGDQFNKKGKKNRVDELIMVHDDHDYDDGYDNDNGNDDGNGKLCCLQALKLSAGKMNLSMGMRFSKAFKGIGLLQTHVRKQGKKGYK